MNLRTNSSRLPACRPVTRWPALLQLVDIVETDAVPTAAVECHAQPPAAHQPRLRGGARQHAREADDAGAARDPSRAARPHRRFSGSAPADNFVFDCVINPLLCRMFPQPAYTALFRDFYPDDVFSACLLRPPPDWKPVIRKVPVPPALRPPGGMDQRGRSTSRCTRRRARATRTSRNVLQAFLARREQVLTGVTLLGDHEGSAHGRATASGNVLASAVRTSFATGRRRPGRFGACR
ncbi:MAG: hypothetical protein IPG83_18185 [Novosphingobium sp.]|nr:hypothetical protein [Novosphingobium sp.]